MRMIHTKKTLSQSRILSITEAKERREGTEKFLGVNVRVIPFREYSEKFNGIGIDREVRKLIASFKDRAEDIQGVTAEALANAAKAPPGADKYAAGRRC